MYCTMMLLADKSLSLPGINLVVVTPEIHVLPKSKDKVVLDVSGSAAKQEWSGSKKKADDGASGSNPHGADGKHGRAGQSGGNVTILCNAINNPEK